MAKIQKAEHALVVSDPEAKVYLTITIGNAQLGGTLVKWEDEQKHIGKGIITNLCLGYGKEVVGRKLEMFTNILDVNPATNGMVATYYFDNCEPSAFILKDKVENDGDICSFNPKVNFS